jgi:hypothetical protein
VLEAAAGELIHGLRRPGGASGPYMSPCTLVTSKQNPRPSQKPVLHSP